MVRPYRLQEENCFYHITGRGDNRKRIFLEDSDYKKFLSYVLKAKDKYRFYLYAYALMPNHYHLLIETLQPNLSKIMHYINTSYATYYNIKRKKCGHLFQGRYKSIVVDCDSYFLQLTRYIHLNPVRKNLAKYPSQYLWSSFRGFLARRGDGYIDKNAIEKVMDMKGSQYRSFVLRGLQEKQDVLFQKVYAGFLLGNTSFIKEKLEDLKIKIERKDFAFKNDVLESVDYEKVIKTVSKDCAIKPEILLSKKSRFLLERKIAIYLLKNCTSLANRRIGEIFSLSPTGVIKAAGKIEKLMEKNRKISKRVNRLISVFSA